MSEEVTLKGNAAVAFENTPQIPVVENDPVPLYYINLWRGSESENADELALTDEGIIDFTKMEDMRNLFEGFKFTSLVLPDGFGQNATTILGCFSYCPYLTSLTIPDNFAIKAYDFGAMCPPSLRTLHIGANFAQGATTVSSLFEPGGEAGLETLTIGEGFAPYAEEAYGCFHRFNGETIELGKNSLMNAKGLDGCFAYCHNLKTLTLPKGFGLELVTGTSLFEGCENLETLVFNEDFMGHPGGHGLSSCFEYCQSLKSLKLPEHFNEGNFENISRCFAYCSALETLELPKNFAKGNFPNYVLANYSSCFMGCTALTSLKLSEGFGRDAGYLDQCFANCESLPSIDLPEGFGENATSLYECFFLCHSLTTLNLPKGFGSKATTLGWCFAECHNLGYGNVIVLPPKCGAIATSIRYCFIDDVSLNALELPEGFGKEATDTEGCFEKCTFLTTITGNPNFKVSVSFSDCPLDSDSAKRIVNGLQEVTETQTITFSATTKTNLTDAGWLDSIAETASNKSWTVAYAS